MCCADNHNWYIGANNVRDCVSELGCVAVGGASQWENVWNGQVGGCGPAREASFVCPSIRVAQDRQVV